MSEGAGAGSNSIMMLPWQPHEDNSGLFMGFDDNNEKNIDLSSFIL